MEHVVSQSLLRRSVSGHLRIRFTGPVETRTARAGLAIGIVAAAVLALPVRVLSTGAGWVDGGTGNHLVPTASFAVGLTCLTAAIWAAARAVTDTSVERASLVALGLTSAAPFGAVTRELLQVSALHRFYLSAGSGGFLAAYWGLALLAVATLSFCLPLMVVAANLVPRRFSSARGRRSITALSHRRGYLLAPMIGAALLITMCAVVPESLGATMGYSAPGANGSRIGVTNDVLNEAVWNSFARLAFLPLLVGVWEGMESARACLLLSGPFGLRRLVDTVASRGSTREGGGGGPGGTRVLAGAATFGACVAAAATHVPLSLLLGAAAVIGVVVYATAGLTPRLAAIPSPRNAGTRWNVSAAWQATSPIALVLLVLAAPVAVPLGLDLWRGLEAPFRLPSDALHYVYFWREPGHMQVPSVTPGGVFGHGMWQVVQWSLALAVVLAVLAATIRLSEHRQPSILTPTFWLLVRVAVIALAFIPIMNAAARPATAWILGAFAAPPCWSRYGCAPMPELTPRGSLSHPSLSSEPGHTSCGSTTRCRRPRYSQRPYFGVSSSTPANLMRSRTGPPSSAASAPSRPSRSSDWDCCCSTMEASAVCSPRTGSPKSPARSR